MTDRIRGRRLQQIRRQMYAESPECARCGVLLAGIEWHVDHIQALCKGGKDIPSNRQILCAPCHETKTRQDLGQRVRPTIGADGYPVEEVSKF